MVVGLGVLVSLPTLVGAEAVQNIFFGGGKIADIQYQGEDIDMVVYRGTVLWEREPEIPLAQTGDYMQTITTANCPTERMRVNDARDGASYWVKKLTDGRCWMLTNLAYGGGGTNTYGDVKSISNGEAGTTTHTTPYYYVPAGSNKTTGTTDPSTSTNGAGQYGYLYNWCAAMGTQTSTSACAEVTTPAPNMNTSICPSGWRLPTGSGGEFASLMSAVGATGSATGTTNLKNEWLVMYSGGWGNGFYLQGSLGYYWSSTQVSATYTDHLLVGNSGVFLQYNGVKRDGLAVRCIAE